MSQRNVSAQPAKPVARYRAGKAPTFKEDNEEVEQFVRRDHVEPVVKKPPVVQVNVVADSGKDHGRRRQQVVAEVIAENVSEDEEDLEDAGGKENESEDEEENEHDLRRARLREKALKKQQEQEEEEVIAEIISTGEDDVGTRTEIVKSRTEEEEEESEEEDDEEEEEFARPKIAPVFKRKSERDTIIDQQKVEEEQEALEKERQRRLEERKKESKQWVKQEVQREVEEKQAAQEAKDDDDIPSEEDEEPTAEDFEKWRLRELARIKREQKEREDAERERQEIERRSQLTDAEIAKEDSDKLKLKPKKKWNYLQKYYNPGAFFRTFDENDIAAKWDFSQPTLEDHVDKSILPKVMQVKNFGKQGRTKYTHLVDQDTTNWDSPWAKKDNKEIREKYEKKRAGVGAIVDPKKRKL